MSPKEANDATDQSQHPEWTFLSNHSHVLHCIFLWPDIRIRDIALKVLITERAVQRIMADLERAGYLKRERVGRQNHYRLEPGLHLRHPLEHHVEVGRLLDVLLPSPAARGTAIRTPRASVVGAGRARNGVASHARAGGISTLKKPRKRSKLVAKRSTQRVR